MLWWVVHLAVTAGPAQAPEPTAPQSGAETSALEDPTAKWRMEASGWFFAGAESQYLGVLLQMDRQVYRSLRLGVPLGMAGSLGVAGLDPTRRVNRLIVRGGPELEWQIALTGRLGLRGTWSLGGIYIRSSAFNEGSSLEVGFDSRINPFTSLTVGPVLPFGSWELALQVELMLTPESTDEAFADVPSRLGPWWLGAQLSLGHRFGPR